MVLLCTLQEFYNNLIVSLKSWVDTDLDIEFVTTRFFHEQLKDKSECFNWRKIDLGFMHVQTNY
jgi:hypothetical protein